MNTKNISWSKRLEKLLKSPKPSLEIKLERAVDRFINFYTDVPKTKEARLAHMGELALLLIGVNIWIAFIWGLFHLR